MAYRKLQTERIALGLCLYCGRPVEAGPNRHLCSACRKKSLISQDRSREKKIRERKCHDCGKTLGPVEKRKRCPACSENRRTASLNRRIRFKQSGACESCGSESIINNGKFRLCETCYLKFASKRHFGTRLKWKALKEMWETQQGICPYTKRQLTLGLDASLDHVYPASRFPHLKYDMGNLQWVHYRVNEMKKDWTPDEFLAFIARITYGK